MSKEYRRKIRPIGEDGEKSIEALIRKIKAKMEKAVKIGDSFTAEKHKNEIERLEERLDDRKKIGCAN